MRRFIYERSPTNIRDWSPAYSFICLPEIETALPEIATSLPEIEILSRGQIPNEVLIFEL